MESRWSSSGRFSQDSLLLQILAEIQNMMTEIKCEPEQLPGRIIFMSMYNDIVRGEKKETKIVYCEFLNCSRICEKIRARPLAVS